MGTAPKGQVPSGSQVPDGAPEGRWAARAGPSAQGLDRRPKRGMTLAAEDHRMRSRLLQPCCSSLSLLPPAGVALVPPRHRHPAGRTRPLPSPCPPALPSSPRLLSSPLSTSNSRALPCLFAHAPPGFVVGGGVGIREFLPLQSSSVFLLTSRV